MEMLLFNCLLNAVTREWVSCGWLAMGFGHLKWVACRPGFGCRVLATGECRVP